jgi:hypothetical protein
MAKLKEDPITRKDLTEFISGQDDFRLEISAYNCLKKMGADAQHGGTYNDPVTELSRQFDIRATIQRNELFIHLAVECKSLKPHFPLLVSTLPRSTDECHHDVIFSFERDQDIFNNPLMKNSDTLTAKSPHSIYKQDEACGKSTTQVGRNSQGEFVNSDSEVYGKWSQAISSAHDLVCNSTDDHEITDNPYACSVILPMLVTNDDVLWTSSYDNDGNLMSEPEMIDSTTVYLGKETWFKGQFISYKFSHLHICTISYFERFIHDLYNEDDIWGNLFPVDQLLKDLK